MAAQAPMAAQTDRYILQGTVRYFFCPTVADVTAPQRTEITGGTELTTHVADQSGWTASTAKVDTPDAGSRWVANIPGLQTADDSSLTLYSSEDPADPVKAALPQDADGYMVIMPLGDLAGTGVCDVFPCRVSSVAKQFALGNEPAKYVVSFAITAPPAIDAPIPA